MDGFGWFPGCTLKKSSTRHPNKNLIIFFQGNCYPGHWTTDIKKILKWSIVIFSPMHFLLCWCFPLASQQRLAWEGLSFHQSIDIFGICFGWHLGCLTGVFGRKKFDQDSHVCNSQCVGVVRLTKSIWIMWINGTRGKETAKILGSFHANQDHL